MRFRCVYNEEQHRCREVAKQNKYKKEKGKVQRQTKETTSPSEPRVLEVPHGQERNKCG
jgi:hypothetical protein